MNLTSIEWVLNPDGSQGYTHNSLTGCRNVTDEGLCKGGGFPCYAYKLANGRLKHLYKARGVAPDYVRDNPRLLIRATEPFYPRFWNERLKEFTKRNDMLWADNTARTRARPKNTKPIGIFLCDMGDLFGIGVPQEWTEKILDEVWGNKGYDRIYTLTKQGRNLLPWSPFPANCWVGITATGYQAFNLALDMLRSIEAKVKYLSVEPLLEAIPFYMERLAYCGVKWVIIGACTGTLKDLKPLAASHPEMTLMPYHGKIWTLQPKMEWVLEIVRACIKADVPVFLKNNLVPMIADSLNPEKQILEHDGIWLRQDMPE